TMRLPLLLAAMLSLTIPVGDASEAAPPEELPTIWEVPPGDPLEHHTAGFAKVLCSAIFITGRNLATAAEEDGFFVSPRGPRRAVIKTIVDRERRAVRLALPNGVTRTAKLYGDQGCVTLPGARTRSSSPRCGSPPRCP